MVFLGLVLAAVAVAFGVDAAVENTAPAKLTVFGQAMPEMTQGQVLLSGVGLAVVLVAGLLIAFFGMARAMRIRRELRHLRDEADESITTLEMQKRQLQRELAHARRDGGQTPVTSMAADSPRATAMPSFFDSTTK
jgi:uncharacterized protein HemX